jgi:hypothetical protein
MHRHWCDVERLDSAVDAAQPEFMIELSEQQIIDQLSQRLAGAYPGVEPDQVSRLVNEEYCRFAGIAAQQSSCK